MRATSTLLVLLCACVGKDAAPVNDRGPADTDASAGPEPCSFTAASDLDPSEDVVEVDLRAAGLAWDPGTGVALENGLAFNGTVPGPLLEATVGQTLRVNFTNDTDLDLTIHWHGLRVSPEMDGVMQMMDPVPPGGSFTYELELKDTGFYWYHPHMDTQTTLERGLYGPIIVRTLDEGRADCELPIVLDDILLDEDTSQIRPPDTDMMQLMGRLGNLMLANGEAGREVALTQGQSVLLRLVSAANARFFDLYLEGHALSVVGTDGGFLAEPYEVEHLLIAPGERYLVTFDATGEPGETSRLMSRRFQLHDEDHADMTESDPLGDEDQPVMSFVYGEGSATGTAWVQPTPDVPSWTGATDTLGHVWELDEDMDAGTVFVDGESWPDVPMVTVVGDTDTTFIVDNRSEMHHPFHIHGNRFQIVAIDGVAPETPQGWKDTWDTPPMSQVTVVGALDNPGEWIYHCHILEHADDGMAGLMTVSDGGDSRLSHQVRAPRPVIPSRQP